MIFSPQIPIPSFILYILLCLGDVSFATTSAFCHAVLPVSYATLFFYAPQNIPYYLTNKKIRRVNATTEIRKTQHFAIYFSQKSYIIKS